MDLKSECIPAAVCVNTVGRRSRESNTRALDATHAHDAGCTDDNRASLRLIVFFHWELDVVTHYSCGSAPSPSYSVVGKYDPEYIKVTALRGGS